MLYVIGTNLYTVVPFIITEPPAPSLVTKVILGTDLSQFLRHLLLPTPEVVARYRIGSPDSVFEYPIPLP